MWNPVARTAAVGAGVILIAGALAGQLWAGQVRINVGVPTNEFSPRAVNMNLGDHAVWVWLAGSHTVTSGDGSTGTADGRFDSGFQGSNLRFGWKSTLTGTIGYFCVPHAPNMAGDLVVTNPSVVPKVPVADFRITEVLFNAPSGQDKIEIANYGAAAGNLGRFRIATTVGTPTELVGPAATPSDILVPSGGRVVIHLNASGTTTNTDIYMSFNPGTGLPNTAGSLALYVPSNIGTQSASSNASLMLDFVQWGAGGQANEPTAVSAGFWGAGASINNVAVGHSIEYCADPDLNHGVDRWAEISPPNFGTNSDCTTPVANATWGRLKTLYRK